MKKILLLNFILSLVAITGFSQISESESITSEKKDSLSLSLNSISKNPDNLINSPIQKNSYSYNYLKPVIIGTEITGSFYNADYPILRSYGVSLAFYPGNSEKGIQGIGELSKQYQLYFDKPSEYNHIDNNLYYAPGISIFSKNKKYSLDLFQSFSSDIFQYGNQNKSHYKLNFRF